MRAFSRKAWRAVRRKAAILLALVWLVCGPGLPGTSRMTLAGSPTDSSQAPVQSGVPAPASGIIPSTVVHGGPPPDLVILYSSEVLGWTEPCG